MYYRNLDPAELEKEIEPLLMNDDVTKKNGVYEYVLSGDERALHICSFTPSQKRGAYERQHGICPYCEKEGNMKHWEFKEMEADHITPWSKGGHTTVENCQMLCKVHNRKKSSI